MIKAVIIEYLTHHFITRLLNKEISLFFYILMVNRIYGIPVWNVDLLPIIHRILL